MFFSFKFKFGSFFTVTEYDTEPEEAAELDDAKEEESEEETKPTISLGFTTQIAGEGECDCDGCGPEEDED